MSRSSEGALLLRSEEAMFSDKDEVWTSSEDLNASKDGTSNLVLTLGEQEVKWSFEVKEGEKEDVISRFSNGEEELLWVDVNKESRSS